MNTITIIATTLIAVERINPQSSITSMMIAKFRTQLITEFDNFRNATPSKMITEVEPLQKAFKLQRREQNTKWNSRNFQNDHKREQNSSKTIAC